MERRYSLEEIRRWLEGLNSPATTVRGVLMYHLSEGSLERANGYTSNTHVENENSLEGGTFSLDKVFGSTSKNDTLY